MKLFTLLKLMKNGQFTLMLKMFKMSREFYRACFVITALSQGIYENFINNKTTLDQLCKKFKIETNREGLQSWLELGVDLGELDNKGNEFHIKGKLSKALLKPENDSYKALLEEIVRYHYTYIMDVPVFLKQNKKMPFDETPGEIVARSSRVSEPFIFESVDSLVPRLGYFHLLEIGCGSGIYIQRACMRNPELNAVGLELQKKVAIAAQQNIIKWGLEDRVTIEHCDVRNFSSNWKFDLVTLHQNIYYFPVPEREDLFRLLMDFLVPNGQILLTTACQSSNPGLQAINIWVSNTEGYGAFPYPEELCQQFRDAGFANVRAKRLIPFESFWACIATKSNY